MPYLLCVGMIHLSDIKNRTHLILRGTRIFYNCDYTFIVTNEAISKLSLECNLDFFADLSCINLIIHKTKKQNISSLALFSILLSIITFEWTRDLKMQTFSFFSISGILEISKLTTSLLINRYSPISQRYRIVSTASDSR